MPAATALAMQPVAIALYRLDGVTKGVTYTELPYSGLPLIKLDNAFDLTGNQYCLGNQFVMAFSQFSYVGFQPGKEICVVNETA